MQTWLEELSEEQCLELLAGASLGRLGVVVNGRPEIFPINHVYDCTIDRVVFPTNRRTKLQAALNWPWVVFEVDGVDSDGSGWSVMVVGRAEEVRDRDLIERSTTSRTAAWGAGDDATWVAIVPAKISGRRISAVPTS